jgi:4-aminobutyrate aminotransferase-like enzyme
VEPRTTDTLFDYFTVAKSIGAGFPLGFSSTGGSPLSSVVGMTVLDIIEDEGLLEHARIVGGHLKARLQARGERHPLVGTVRGSGLYLGLEFVRDRETLEPATEETAAICDRLLELGVIMQPTGDTRTC